MRTVDSDALGIVGRSLGLSGTGAPSTQFDDGRLVQTLPVEALIRRGRTQAATQGIYTGVLRNIHAGSGDESSQINPFTTPVGAIAPYPSPMDDDFDLWLLSAIVRQESGTGTLEAVLSITFGAAAQGFGIDSAGVAVVTTFRHPVAFWDSVNTVVIEFGLQENGQPEAIIGKRLPRHRDTLLNFDTTASALATFMCQMVIGVFPTALGQDVNV